MLIPDSLFTPPIFVRVLLSARAGRAPAHTLQILLFSATLPAWVQGIADKYMRPDRVEVDCVRGERSQASTDVQHLVVPVHWQAKTAIISDLLCMCGK